MASQLTPFRQVRAVFDDREITVYQAYSPRIAGPAVAAGTFVAPFSFTRMTWIKPSFLWMMYRCGWAAKPVRNGSWRCESPGPGSRRS